MERGSVAPVQRAAGQNHGTPGAKLAAQGGAVSEDGSRVYFTDQGNLYLREAGTTYRPDEAQGGGGEFQTAVADDSLAFFTKAGHLYRYDAAIHAATDLTPVGGVVGVLGASEDGSTVYFQDAAGLEQWREGTTTQVVLGVDTVQESDCPPITGTARLVLTAPARVPLAGSAHRV